MEKKIVVNRCWLLVSSNPEREQALFDWAVESCLEQNIDLNVIVVLPKIAHHIFEWLEEHQHQDIMQKQIDFELSRRKQWVDTAKQKEVRLTIEVRFGKLYYETIQQANEKKAELLIKQSDDLEDRKNFLFQSDDWHLLRKSPVPLLLYRAQTALPFKSVMASLDVDIEIQPYQPSVFNQSLLVWADRFKGSNSVKVVHAWQSEVENLVKHWDADLNENELIELNEQLYFQHKEALDLELKAHSPVGDKTTVFWCKGEPADSIFNATLEQKVDLLVLGTLGRSGVPGMLIGNTAEDLLERVNCSVLAIKPNAFKSPIS